MVYFALLRNLDRLHFWSGWARRSLVPTNWLLYLKQKRVCAETYSYSRNSVQKGDSQTALLPLPPKTKKQLNLLSSNKKKVCARVHHLPWSLEWGLWLDNDDIHNLLLKRTRRYYERCNETPDKETNKTGLLHNPFGQVAEPNTLLIPSREKA